MKKVFSENGDVSYTIAKNEFHLLPEELAKKLNNTDATLCKVLILRTGCVGIVYAYNSDCSMFEYDTNKKSIETWSDPPLKKGRVSFG